MLSIHRQEVYLISYTFHPRTTGRPRRHTQITCRRLIRPLTVSPLCLLETNLTVDVRSRVSMSIPVCMLEQNSADLPMPKSISLNAGATLTGFELYRPKSDSRNLPCFKKSLAGADVGHATRRGRWKLETSILNGACANPRKFYSSDGASDLSIVAGMGVALSAPPAGSQVRVRSSVTHLDYKHPKAIQHLEHASWVCGTVRETWTSNETTAPWGGDATM